MRNYIQASFQHIIDVTMNSMCSACGQQQIKFGSDTSEQV